MSQQLSQHPLSCSLAGAGVGVLQCWLGSWEMVLGTHWANTPQSFPTPPGIYSSAGVQVAEKGVSQG